MLSHKKKRLNYAILYELDIFKWLCHNLKLLCFQKMCGLWAFIWKTKAQEWSARGRSWRVASWYLNKGTSDRTTPTKSNTSTICIYLSSYTNTGPRASLMGKESGIIAGLKLESLTRTLNFLQVLRSEGPYLCRGKSKPPVRCQLLIRSDQLTSVPIVHGWLLYLIDLVLMWWSWKGV